MKMYALMFASLASMGCSLLVDMSSDQCTLDEDCKQAGFFCLDGVCFDGASGEVGAPDTGPAADATPLEPDASGLEDGPWACVGQLEIPPVASETVTLTISVNNLIMEPRADVTGRACNNLDINCDSPIAEDVTAEDGLIHLTVGSTFNGYVELTHPETVPVLSIMQVETIAYFDSGEYLVPRMQVPTFDEVGLLLMLATGEDTEFDTTRAGLLILGLGCDAEGMVPLAEDVAFNIEGMDEDTIQWYYENSLPTQTRDRSDMSGTGGFINVPVGIFDLKMRLPPDAGGQLLGELSFFTRAGWFTAMIVKPTLKD